jgi:hypothetical protein
LYIPLIIRAWVIMVMSPNFSGEDMEKQSQTQERELEWGTVHTHYSAFSA